MLLYPFTEEGEVLPSGQSPNILVPVSEVVNPISSSAFTTRESALSDEKESWLLTRFLAAMYTANFYLQNPWNKKCAVNAIAKQLNVSSEVAQLAYTDATNADTGEVSCGDFTVNSTGLLNIIAVRDEFGGFANLPSDYNFSAAIVPGPGKLIDYTLRDAALVNLKWNLLFEFC